jgi:hypothetical protein
MASNNCDDSSHALSDSLASDCETYRACNKFVARIGQLPHSLAIVLAFADLLWIND